MASGMGMQKYVELLEQHQKAVAENEQLRQQLAQLLHEMEEQERRSPWVRGIFLEDCPVRGPFLPPSANNGHSPMARIYVGGREVYVPVAQGVDLQEIRKGRVAILNPDSVVIGVGEFFEGGEISLLSRILPNGRLALRKEGGEGELVVIPAGALDPAALRPGESVRHYAGLALESLGRPFDIEDFLVYPPQVTFQEVVGLERLVADVRRMIDRRLDRREKGGRDSSLYLIFYGLAGNGKTLFCSAALEYIARRLGLLDRRCVLLARGGDLQSKWVGEAERRFKALIEQAAELASVEIHRDRAGREPVVEYVEAF